MQVDRTKLQFVYKHNFPELVDVYDELIHEIVETDSRYSSRRINDDLIAGIEKFNDVLEFILWDDDEDREIFREPLPLYQIELLPF